MDILRWSSVFLALLVLGLSEPTGGTVHGDSRCLVGHVPTYRSFDVRKFAGTWYMLSMLEGTADFTTAVINFVLRSDTLMSSYFYSAQGTSCRPEIPGSWHLGSIPGDMFTDYGLVSGPAKIVYVNADYTYATIYQCFRVNPDGTCAVKFVDYIGRSPTLPAEVKRELSQHLRGMCARGSDFIDMSSKVPRCLRQKVLEYSRLDRFMADGPRAPAEQTGPSYAEARLMHTILEYDRTQPLRDSDVLLRDAASPQNPDREGIPAQPQQPRAPAIVKDDDRTIKRLLELEEEGDPPLNPDKDIKSNVKPDGLLEDRPPEGGTAGAGAVQVICGESICPDPCPRKFMRVDSFGCNVCICEHLPSVDEKLSLDDLEDPQEEQVDLQEGSKSIDQTSGGDSRKTDGGTLTSPPPPCAQPMCEFRCPHGYVYTQQGCMTCECQDDPSEEEDIPLGELGVKPDDNDDDVDIIDNTRVVRPQVPCATPMCAHRCPGGYLYNEMGCMTCQCREDNAAATNLRRVDVPCPILICLGECPHGYKHTQRGCMTCECLDFDTGDVPCAVPMCLEECPNGYRHTEKGCMTCDCIAESPPSNLQVPDVSGQTVEGFKEAEVPCATPMCSDRCPHGYRHTEKGCMTCECLAESPPSNLQVPDVSGQTVEGLKEAEVPCATPMCAERCPHGYRHTEKGCMTCECLADSPASNLQVPDVSGQTVEGLKEAEVPCATPMCAERCPHGYSHTEKGCMTCECLERPPSNAQLSEHTKAVPQEEPCATPICLDECSHGYKHTEKGCMTCECLEVTTTAATVSCRPEDIPATDDINIERFAGRWYILSMLPGTVQFSSGTIYLHVHNETSIASFFTAAQGSQCFPTMRGTWTRTGTSRGSFTADYNQRSGPLKIIHVDSGYEYAMVYQCFQTNSDGTCQQVYIDLIGRQPLLPASVKLNLLTHAPKACAGSTVFIDLPQTTNCSAQLPPSMRRSCKVQDFPTATDLDWNRMLGHWYTVVQPRDGEDLHAGEYLLKAQPQGAVSIIFHAYSDGECIEPRHATIYPKPTNPGQMTIQVGHSKSEGRIIFTDYTSMVFYQCSRVTTNGECMKGHDAVEVLHRQRRPTRHLVNYTSIIEGLCIDSERITNVSHDVTCPIRDFCRVDDVQGQANLDITKFSGRWYTMATLATDMTWDYVMAIFTRETSMNTSVWYTGSKNGHCLPTARAYLSTMGSTQNMTMTFGRTQATFKVLYTDYTNYAVTYECERKSRDGHCSHGAEHLEVLSRREGGTLSEELLEQLAPHLSTACKEKEDLRPTRKEVECPIRRPSSACKIDYLQTPDSFDLKRFSGTWYVIAKNKMDRGITSTSVQMTLSEDSTIVYSVINVARRGRCISGDTKALSVNPNYPAEFFTSHGRHRDRSRVIFVSTEYDSSVIYSCDLEAEDGSCVEGHAKVSILSRSTEITAEAKVDITEALFIACIEPSTMHDMAHTGQCLPEQRRQPPPRQPPTMSVDSIPAMKKLDNKQFLGRWYILVRMSRSPTLDGDAVVDLSEGADGIAFNALYRGSRSRTCVPPAHATWHLRSTDQLSDFTVTSPGASGRLKIIQTDYDTALVYECHKVRQNGRCVEGQDSLDWYSRSNRVIPEEKRTEFLLYGQTLGIARARMRRVRHNLNCTTAHTRICSLDTIPVMARVDIPRLMGTWYSSSRVASASSWNAGVVNFDLLDDGNVLAKYTGARKGKCMKVTAAVLRTSTGKAEFMKANGGVIKLVFTNYQQALIYDCDVIKNNTCESRHRIVGILSRSPDPLPASFMTQISPYLRDVCLEESDFVTTVSNVDCSETLFEQEECIIRMEDITVQRYFDINMLLGEWYGYAHTNGEDSMASSKNLLSRDEEGNLKVYYTGSRSGRCAATKEATLEVSDSNPSFFTIYHEGKREHALILHVTPDELVIYTCYLRLPDGTCASEHTSLDIFRRRQNMLAGMSPRVRQAVSRACFNPAQFTLTVHNVDCPLEVPHTSCAFADLPVDRNFDIRALTGHWYTVSRLTPRGDLKRKSSRNYIIYKSSDELGIQWTARIGEKCVAKKHGTMKAIPNDHPGIFRSTFGSWTSITKFLHLSDNYAITFECVQPSSGTDVIVSACPLSEAEVEIHSRRPTTPQTAINVLKDILRQKTCINVNRMDDMQPADTCQLHVREEKSCKLDEIPMHPNVTMTLLEGPWFQISHTNTTSILPRHDGELFIDTKDHHAGWMALHMRGKIGPSSAVCAPTYRVKAYSSSLDRAHWMFMNGNSVTMSSGTLKIVHVDANLLILHTCLGQSPIYRELCDKNKEDIQVYSHRRYLNQRDRRTVRDVLRHKLCVDERQLHRTGHAERCGIPRYAHKQRGPPSCKVADYKVQANFQPRKFGGVWYEVERTRFSEYNIWESSVSHVAFQPPSVLSFSHAGSREGECVGPLRTHLTPTGRGNSSGDLTMWLGERRLVGSPWSIHFPFKVIWTDYEMAVAYSCHQVDNTGTCHQKAEHVHVLSRSPEVTTTARLNAYNVITENLCVDVVDLVEPHQEADCLSVFGLDLPSRRSTTPRPRCPALDCGLNCPHGYAHNDAGCDVCQCRHLDEEGSGDIDAGVVQHLVNDGSGEADIEPVVMETVRHVRRDVSDGSGEEEDIINPKAGMGITETPDVICAPIECQRQCHGGYKKDRRGCSICECQNSSPGHGGGELERAVPRCQPTVCFFLYCPHGFKTDSNGCIICACAEGQRTSSEPETKVKLFWVNKGLGRYGIQRAIVEPYIKGKGSPSGLVSDGAAETNLETMGAHTEHEILEDVEENKTPLGKEPAQGPKQGVAQASERQTTQSTAAPTTTASKGLLERILSYI